jgi:hypothetical protein
VRGRVTKAKIDLWPHWAYDNGAFADWKAGRTFDGNTFWTDIHIIASRPKEHRPDFAVLPDIVAGGHASLIFSLTWLVYVGHLPIRWALAVQDGMTPEDIPWEVPFDVIFVGGSIDWKLSTGALWTEAAHSYGRICHIGRVGSAKRVAWASKAGADSIDSALPLWSADKERIFLTALKKTI